MRLAILLTIIILILFSCEIKQDPSNDSLDIAISIVEPNNDSVINDTLYIECQTNSEESIVKVELWFDGDSTGIEDLLEPFTLLLDSRNYENGFHNFFVKGYDKDNNTYNSETISIKIVNFSLNFIF